MVGRRTRRVVIVGAGIAGLAGAVALSRFGWEVTLVERAPGLRGGAYVVGFSGLGYDAAEQLGLTEEIHLKSSPWTDVKQVDADGDVIAQMPVRLQQALVGKRIVSILRGELERILHRAVENCAEIRFGRTIADFEDCSGELAVALDDGSVIHCDLLLGADGLHSDVRRLAFGPEYRYRYDFNASVVSFNVDHPPDQVRDQTTLLSLKGRGAGIYPQHDGGMSAFFTFSDDRERLSRDDPYSSLFAAYGDLRWVWPELISQVENNNSVFFDKICQIRMTDWTRGRVALLGDAAWSVSLLAGAGASLAVGGAYRLAILLESEPDASLALSRWNGDLRSHVRLKQWQGRLSRQLFIPTSGFSVSCRHAGMRLAEKIPVHERRLCRPHG